VERLGELLGLLRSVILYCSAYKPLHMPPVLRQEGRGSCLTLIALFPEALEYNFGVPRAYTSRFKRLKDEFCREGRLPGALEQCEEVAFLDGQHPLRFKEVNVEGRGVVR